MNIVINTKSFTGYRIRVIDDSGEPVTGMLAADFPPIFYTSGSNAAANQISLNDLALITSPYAAGGIKEDAGGVGVYRLDLPDDIFGMISERAVYGDVSGKHVFAESITVEAAAFNDAYVNAQNSDDITDFSTYNSSAALDSYFAGKLYTRAWDDADETTRRKASIQATRIMDRLAYKNPPATIGHAFPQIVWGICQTDIPQPILQAHAEITYALLDGVDPEKEYENLRVSSQRFSSVGSTYSSDIPEYVVAGIPSVVAWQLIKPYLRAAQEIKLSRV